MEIQFITSATRIGKALIALAAMVAVHAQAAQFNLECESGTVLSMDTVAKQWCLKDCPHVYNIDEVFEGHYKLAVLEQKVTDPEEKKLYPLGWRTSIFYIDRRTLSLLIDDHKWPHIGGEKVVESTETQCRLKPFTGITKVKI